MKQSIEQVKKFILEQSSLAIIGTADQEGFPHLAMERGVRWVREKTVEFESWFCETTVKNLRENPKVSVAIFDQKTQKGYQLLGRIESIHEGAILDGYIPGEKPGEQDIPSQAYRIDIAIEKILFFSSGPHSDGALL
ncbi:MAG: pyridoxamine 5'-phosphate oxidase family protein [bacterium]